MSTTVFASIGAVEITTKKIDTNSLSELAPKPANTTKIIDAKALDSLMQPSLEQTQSEKSNNLLSSSAAVTSNSPTASNFKTATKYEFVKNGAHKELEMVSLLHHTV